MNTPQPFPTGMTASQIWDNLMREELDAQLTPLVLTAMRTSALKEKVNHQANLVALAAIRVTTTRLRVTVDAVIALGEGTTRRLKELRDQHERTSRLLFWIRRRLLRQAQEQATLQEAYSKVILILVNTLPPPPAPKAAPPVDRARMRVNGKAPTTVNLHACRQCGGTGLAGPSPEEQFECTHCNGTGVEPQKGGNA